MIAGYHTLKIARRRFADRTEVNVHDHEQRNDESGDYVQEIRKMESAPNENGNRNGFRIEHGPSCNENHRYEQVHDHYIGKLLEGIEFLFRSHWKWDMFLFKDPDRVIQKLLLQPYEKRPEIYLVVLTIVCNNIPDEKDDVTDS